MESLAKALQGRWSITEKYEPDEWTPNGGTGYGEEVWRRGPGGFTFMEEIHDHTPSGEQFGVGFSWWDRTKGLRGFWCISSNPQGCDLQSAVSGFGPQWDGNQLVIHTEFPRDGKNFEWHEVFFDITPISFTQTADIGEKGGPLKRWLTIHATRTQETAMEYASTDSAEAELRAFMAELRKASLEGDVDTIANSMTDDYVQTDINGYRQDKSTWLSEYFRPLADLIKAGKFHWDEYERKGLQIRFHGGSAIVTGELQLKGSGAKFGPQHAWLADPNASFSGTLHFTHVYIKRNGRWLIAALHNQLPPYPAQTCSADPSTSTNDITAIQQSMLALRSAELKYDSAAAANLLDDDFLLTAADGNLYPKPEFLKLVADRSNPLEVFEFSKMTVHLYDSTAVVSARLHEKGYMDGKPYELNGRPTWTWVKRNNRWLCVAAHD